MSVDRRPSRRIFLQRLGTGLGLAGAIPLAACTPASTQPKPGGPEAAKAPATKAGPKATEVFPTPTPRAPEKKPAPKTDAAIITDYIKSKQEEPDQREISLWDELNSFWYSPSVSTPDKFEKLRTTLSDSDTFAGDMTYLKTNHIAFGWVPGVIGSLRNSQQATDAIPNPRGNHFVVVSERFIKPHVPPHALSVDIVGRVIYLKQLAHKKDYPTQLDFAMALQGEQAERYINHFRRTQQPFSDDNFDRYYREKAAKYIECDLKIENPAWREYIRGLLQGNNSPKI